MLMGVISKLNHLIVCSNLVIISMLLVFVDEDFRNYPLALELPEFLFQLFVYLWLF